MRTRLAVFTLGLAISSFGFSGQQSEFGGSGSYSADKMGQFLEVIPISKEELKEIAHHRRVFLVNLVSTIEHRVFEIQDKSIAKD